jgi:hypothetical protein
MRDGSESSQGYWVPRELQFPKLPQQQLFDRASWVNKTQVRVSPLDWLLTGPYKPRSEKLSTIDDSLAEYERTWAHCIRARETFAERVDAYLKSAHSDVEPRAIQQAGSDAGRAMEAVAAGFARTDRLFRDWTHTGDDTKRGPTVNELGTRLNVLRPQILQMRTELNDQARKLVTQITTLDVVMILRQARAFYRAGDKAGNKMYLNTDTDKTSKRNWKAERVNASLPQLREYMKEVPFEDQGAYLEQRNVRYGNCDEMAALTAKLARSTPQLSDKMKHLWITAVNPSDGHTFVLLGDGHEPNFPKRPISQWPKQDLEALWVIDTWINTACRASDYEHLAREKLAKWHRERKIIVAETTDDQWGNPIPLARYSNREFADRLFSSPATLIPISLKGPQQRPDSNRLLTAALGRAARTPTLERTKPRRMQ